MMKILVSLSLAVIALLVGPNVNADDLKTQCPPNKYWVSPHPKKSHVRKTGIIVRATDVTGHCRTKSKAYDYWSTQLTNGFIEGWPHKTEKFKSWNQKDIEAVIEAFEKVPSALWRKLSVHRAGKSQTSGNKATWANGYLTLYDNAFEDSKLLSRILTHEIGHQIYFEFDDFMQLAFRNSANWQKSGEDNFVLRRKRWVEPDSDQSPGEDFANNLEYFVLEPEKLKTLNPELFDWYEIEFADKIKGER